MNLLVGYKKKKCRSRGFSIIEILIVFGLVMILVGMTTPVGFRYYQVQLLDESVSLIFDTLLRAQQYALLQKNDSAFGVYFNNGEFVLFEGDSFVSRDQDKDESFVFSEDISIIGSQEIVFSKREGVPSATGTITISSGSLAEYIEVNSVGRVDKQ